MLARELIAALDGLLLIEALASLAAVLEKKPARGTYTYEDVTLKRWVLGDGGRAGNCELCVDNSDLGWIDMDAIFEGTDEDIDEPPAHPHCTCTVEYKDTRKRVYV